MNTNQFVTAINCMDGRVQIPVIEYMKTTYDVEYIDMITEPGPIKTLSKNRDRIIVESIKTRVEMSVMKHNSKLIAIVGHNDCAGNPVDKGTQLNQIQSAIKIVESWNFKAKIIGLWIDENWEVFKVA